MCLFSCQYQTILITVALYYSLMPGTVIPPTLFFLKIAVPIGGHLCFHVNFRNVFSILVKYVIDISIGIALNLYIAMGSMDISMMLIFPIHEHIYDSIYLCLP